MVTLAESLSVLFPLAVPLRDYTVCDDGTGPRISGWHLPDPQPTAEQIAAVTPEQVKQVRLEAGRSAASVAVAVAADAVAVANRAAESFGVTRDNDLAETLRALCDLVGVSLSQLVERIESNRQTTPPPAGAPYPAAVVASATERVGADVVVQQMIAFIDAGAGDPLATQQATSTTV